MSPEAAIAAPFLLPIKASSPLRTSVILESAAGSAKMKQSVSIPLRSAHRHRMPGARRQKSCIAYMHAHWNGIWRANANPSA